MASVTPVSWPSADDELLAALKAKAKSIPMKWSPFVVKMLREAHEGALARENQSAAILAELKEIKQLLLRGAQVQADTRVPTEDDQDDVRDKALSALGL